RASIPERGRTNGATVRTRRLAQYRTAIVDRSDSWRASTAPPNAPFAPWNSERIRAAHGWECIRRAPSRCRSPARLEFQYCSLASTDDLSGLNGTEIRLPLR